MSPTNRKQILPDLVRSVLASWLFAVCLEWFLFPASARNLSSDAPMPEGSLLRVLAITVVGTALLLTLARRRSCAPVVRLSVLVLTTVLLAAALFANRFRYFAAACALLALAAAVYAVRGWRSRNLSRAPPEKSGPGSRRCLPSGSSPAYPHGASGGSGVSAFQALTSACSDRCSTP